MASTINWPATLPTFVLEEGYQRTILSNTVVSENEAGPRKVRRRNTKQIINYTASMPMTVAQLSTFETFHRSSLGYGAVSFNFPDPENNSQNIEVRFNTSSSAGYSVSPENGSTTHYIVDMELETV